MKITIAQIYVYSLIGLISSTVAVSIITQGMTQTADNFSTQSTPISTSGFVWPAQGKISQGFRKYNHEGIDIAGPSGTPVIAAASGKVIKAGWDDWGLGYAIEIQHSNGSSTVYGHNRRLLVKKGQQVSQGQVIAEMGSTGNSTAPHLHFEIYPNRRIAVNPLSLLPPLVADQIPSPRIATAPTASQGSRYKPTQTPSVIAPQNSQRQPIPIPVSTPHMAEIDCNGILLIDGETANAFVKVCQENGQLFYIGQLKQDPTKPVRLLAWNVGKIRYRADNGDFSYLVNPDGVEVWHNGHQIRSERFYVSNSFIP
jgi:lipoprotein NlpD